MTDWCILINTTPRYLSLAEVQITCLRRYAPQLVTVPIFLATELALNHPIVKRILLLPNVQYVSLNLNEFCYRFNRRFWEPELPLRLLNACLAHVPVRQAEFD